MHAATDGGRPVSLGRSLHIQFRPVVTYFFGIAGLIFVPIRFWIHDKHAALVGEVRRLTTRSNDQ